MTAVGDIHDHRVRAGVFGWMREQITIHGDVLPWSLISNGFQYHGRRVPLIGPSGIWKPEILNTYPISITTSPNSPYPDRFSEDGNFLQYRYRGTDPDHRDNVLVKKAMQDQVPLIYFIGLRKGWYFVSFPVYVIGADDSTLTFTIAAEDTDQLFSEEMKVREFGVEDPKESYQKRKYITVQVQQRLHQRTFRERVLMAYRSQCAVCRLKHPELLDAAHILEDKDPKGEPVVSNGLSLCKIHHAAFDRHILGISPDYVVEIREDILQEHDGPMLKHGLQERHKQKIIVPRKEIFKPNREFLEERFNKFRNAS